MIKKSLAANARGLLKNKRKFSSANQSGSMLLEAVIVLGMVATFTPLLYKHVADRRAEIENINRANTLLYLQQRTEEYLKNSENVKALVTELGHNEHKEIFPSELGIGNNFDGRYIIGIRRDDENNKPVLKAMIIDTVNTGSDLRAAKVAELIGVSAGIYTAVDPDAAWGINGLWSEPLERYFDNTSIPTGAVAVTTEYNKEKYRLSISDILVDADLDLGEFELTAEQINAINIAAERGTIGELLATTEVASPKLVSSGSICFRKNGEENCIESWEGLGGQDSSDLMLVQMCNSGLTEMCMLAFAKDLNTSCSKVDAVYDRFGATYPSPKVYTLTYGTGGSYGGEVRVKCEGTQFVVENISTSTLANTVEQVGDTAFGITTPGWYQITLMGEAGYWKDGGGYTSNENGSGGILIVNKQFSEDEFLTIKAIKGGDYPNYPGWLGGAGVALWNTINPTGAPALVAGGGVGVAAGGGGYNGGATNWKNSTSGYSWDGTRGNSTNYCNSATCNIGATGGKWGSSSSTFGFGGTGYCSGGYTCTTIAGGNCINSAENYPASTYGNWGTNTLTGGKGYASIVYCGLSESDCSAPCNTDSDCPSDIPYCSDGTCTATKSCTASSQCTVASLPYCVSNVCSANCTADSQCPSGQSCESGTCISTASKDATLVYSFTNIDTNTCSSVNTTTHACSGSSTTSGVITLESYRIPSPGKYMVVVAGAQGYCPNGGGYQDGGVLVVEKTFSSQTLTLKSISGGVGCSCWGGAGVAVVDSDLTSAPALVAGGGAGNTRAGGGLIGGWGANGYNSSCGPCGFSYDGTRGNYSVSSTLGMDNAQGGGGGYQASPIWVSRGGSGSTSVTVTAAGYRALNVVAGGWGPDVPAGTGNVGDGYVKIYRCDPKTLVCCGSDPFVPKCDNSGN